MIISTKNIDNDLAQEVKKVKEMQRIHTQSKANQLCNLSVNDSISETIRLNLDNSKVNDITSTLSNLRSKISRNIADARERSGFKFSAQSLVGFTSNYDIAISLVVTRES